MDLFEALSASGGSLIYLLWRYATSNINIPTTCTYALSQEQRVDLFEAHSASGGSLKYLLWRYATNNINHSPTCTLLQALGLQWPLTMRDKSPHSVGLRAFTG